MIKTIIFDFDNTIYFNSVIDTYPSYLRTALKTIFKTEEEIDAFYKRNNFSPDPGNENIIRALEREGRKFNKFYRYIKNNVYMHDKKANNVLPNEFFEELSKKYSVYCVSLSGQKYLKVHFKEYGIKKKYFKAIVSTDLLRQEKSKTIDYIYIQQKENVAFDQMLMVGDNYANDIEPAEKLGMKALHFKQKSFDQIYDYFIDNKILDCTRFKSGKK